MKSFKQFLIEEKEEKCYACGKPLGKSPNIADTKEDQIVSVGSECYKKILSAKGNGWRPPKGGPKLYVLTPERKEYFKNKGWLK